jgi:hypothetical protein
MRELLASERDGELYRKRQPMIEPVFAQMNFRVSARLVGESRAAMSV